MTVVEARQESLPVVAALTEREQEILNLVAQGWTNQQIATELVVAHTTVRWYLRQIYAKLGATGREEAVARAHALGIAAASAAPPRRSSNLPIAPTPFVGRQPELRALNDLFSIPTHG